MAKAAGQKRPHLPQLSHMIKMKDNSMSHKHGTLNSHESAYYDYGLPRRDTCFLKTEATDSSKMLVQIVTSRQTMTSIFWD